MDEMRENVIRGLEHCVKDECKGCPYYQDCGMTGGFSALAGDALSLLKAQEPVKPYMDYDGRDVWRCGNCGVRIYNPKFVLDDGYNKNYHKFCFHCGRAVKWE